MFIFWYFKTAESKKLIYKAIRPWELQAKPRPNQWWTPHTNIHRYCTPPLFAGQSEKTNRKAYLISNILESSQYSSTTYWTTTKTTTPWRNGGWPSYCTFQDSFVCSPERRPNHSPTKFLDGYKCSGIIWRIFCKLYHSKFKAVPWSPKIISTKQPSNFQYCPTMWYHTHCDRITMTRNVLPRWTLQENRKLRTNDQKPFLPFLVICIHPIF